MKKIKLSYIFILFFLSLSYFYKYSIVFADEIFSINDLNIYPFMDKNTYEVTLDETSKEVNINTNLEDVIWSKGLGTVTLEVGKVHEIIIMNSEGEVTIYNIYPNNDIAKINNITINEKNFTFDKNIYNYELIVSNLITDLTFNITSDTGVTYNIIKPSKLEVGTNEIKIEANKEGAVSTTYTFNVVRKPKFNSQLFDYSGNYQEFVAPVTGTYKLEVWGASGGSAYKSAGGLGGYSKGYYKLNEGDIVYVYVGGKGTTGTSNQPGGWNGGGQANIGSSKQQAGSGGGATDIRLVSGAWNNNASLQSRLIVAGGGGGASIHYQYTTSAAFAGGAGGGLKGVNGSTAVSGNPAGTGGSQTSGGVASGQSVTYGGFGYGGPGKSATSSASGGGGGYYGGGGSYCAGAGGGSGYIGGVSACDVDVCNGDTAVTISGNSSIPTYDGTNTMTGNNGNGKAKITLMIKNEVSELDELASLSVDKGTISPEFDPDVKEYNLSLGNDVTEITISAKTKLGEASLSGIGKFSVLAGDNVYPIIMTNTDGSTTIYNINVTRELNPSAHLKAFKVNGVYYDCTGEADLEKIVYNITVPTNTLKINLELIKLVPGQIIPTDTIYDFDVNNLTKTIIVESEGNISNQYYEFNFIREKSTKLKTLDITGGTLLEAFDPNVFQYDLEMTTSGRVLNVDATAWFPESVITMTEPRYVGINDKTLTIKVELEGVAPTIYTFNIKRLDDLPEDPGTTFTCTKNYVEYTATYSGIYRFDTWGAEGAGVYYSTGGKGGYAKGYYYLNAGDKVYVYVGCKGTSGTVNQPGGWNGGGQANIGSSRQPAGSGGGATDIRLVSGAWNNIASLQSRLIVAGGGGGASVHYSYTNRNFSGGAGGGLKGISGTTAISGNPAGTGGSQTNGGVASGQSVTYGGFGYGGPGKSATSSASGGGGGYYGGGGSYCAGAGGGSSYIGNLIKCNNDEATTIDGNSLMPTHDGTSVMTGNSGDGFAKIKRMSLSEADTFLDNIILNDGTINIDFEPWTLTYNINVDKKTSKVKIDAIAKDVNATVSGTGTKNLNPGLNTFVITVTGHDGSKKDYTLNITKEADDDASPLNILVKNPHSYLCNVSEGTCIYNFDPTTLTYTIRVPYPTEKLTFQTILRSTNQSVQYSVLINNVDTVVTDSTFDITDITTNINVQITAEDGTKRTYSYEIIKDDKGNNSLDDLKIIDPPGIDLNFNSKKYEYSIVVPNATENIELEYVKSHPDATVSITGDKNLVEGLNDVIVTVTAPNKMRRSYIIHVYREKSSNTLLNNLEVFDNENNKVELVPTFNKLITSYNATVASTVLDVRIEATPLEGSKIINPITNGIVANQDGTYTLVSGINKFEIVVTSNTGETQIHDLIIVKEKNNNANLANIEIKDYQIDPEFNKDILYYTVEVPSDVKTLDIKVTPEEPTTTYTISGNNNLNSTTNTIVITSIAEDKSYKVYEITVIKELSTNNFLSDITIDGISLTDFDKTKDNYTYNVPSNVSSINIKGIPEDSHSNVIGNGVYAISAKDPNIITLKVISESGSDKTYTITITKDVNNDTSLKEVKNNQGSIVTKVEDQSLGYDYLINVQYEVNQIEIEGIANASTSVVSGNGTYSLNIGNNDITLIVTSESGDIGTYIVRVIRDKSTNDDLSFLYVEEGALQPDFKETTILYDVYIPNNKTEVHITAITEDKNATYEIVGDTTNLEVNTPCEIKVVVTAEAGNQKTYTLNIIRQEATTNNLALLKLETNRGELSPTFNPDTLNYTLEVENEISDITISAEALSDNVTVEGVGTKSLKVGKNALSVIVRGEDGIERDYQIVVTRKKSSDATLASLVVKGHTLSPSFNKETENYTLKTSSTSLEFTTIKPSEEEATYEVTGNENFTTGENIVIITVTAPDGTTTKTYTLTVTKEGSKNNNLASLEVVGYTLKPVFHKGVTFYAVEVPNNVNSIIINATSEDKNATIVGTGTKVITTGENYFDVEVESEAGTKKIYKVLVTKEESDNNYLASLYSNVGIWDTSFVKTTNNYIINVPYTTSSIELSGTLEDSNATVGGLGIYSLNVGSNNIDINVTSESGLKNTYNITVIREALASAYLTDIKVTDYELDPEFNKEIFEYYINVNNETTSLDLSYIKEDSNANVTVTGNESFEIGMNEVVITVTRVVSEEVTLENTYILYVNRNMSTNNYLSSITISEGTLNPTFNKEVTEYTIEVDRSVDKINIDVMPEDSASTIVSKLGDYDLDVGENTILIKVKSSIGIIRTYKLIVNRKYNTNNYLASLNVINGTDNLSLDKPFNKTENIYNVTASSDISYVELTGTLEDNLASVTGLGIKTITAGLNRFEIVVTAEDGTTNTYVVNIMKEVSSNNYLSSLIPSSGILDPEFNKETLEYTLNLTNDVETLGFNATLESSLATVTGIESLGVSEGESYRNIIVTAENGDKRTYKIKIIKESISNALLDSLTVKDYPFEFDSDTFTYNLSVSGSKRKLLENEITAIAKDAEATVNLMGDLELKEGIVNIYVIEVIARDGYTTEEYRLNITRDSEEHTIRSDVYNIVRDDSDEDYVIRIEPNQELETFMSNFKNDRTTLKLYDKEDVEVTSINAVGTGAKVKLIIDNIIYDEVRVIVSGDTNGDGKVNVSDSMQVNNTVLKKIVLSGYQFKAGDINHDGKINVSDSMLVNNYVLKKIATLLI